MRVKPEGQATSGSLKLKSAMLVHIVLSYRMDSWWAICPEGLLLFLLSQSVSENPVSHLRDKLQHLLHSTLLVK